MAKGVVQTPHDRQTQLELKYPLFVKPVRGGSSIGVRRVSVSKDLEGAVNAAFEEDDQVLIEECIEGRELTAGVSDSLNGAF